MNKKKEDKEEKSFITLTIGEKSDVLLVGQLDFDKLAKRVETLEKKTNKSPENEWITDLKLLPQWEFDVLVKLKASGATVTYLGYYCIDELVWTIHGETPGFQTDEVLAWRFIPRFNDK